MKKTVMKKWVNELRSDRYKQGAGLLKKKYEDGTIQHCCLGVLCELYQSEMKKNKKKQLNEVEEDHPNIFDLTDTMAYSFDGDNSRLPEAVIIWGGIHDQDRELQNCLTQKYESLADMNDNGESFETIADVIEKEWENL
jgi:hypothetical protein